MAIVLTCVKCSKIYLSKSITPLFSLSRPNISTVYHNILETAQSLSWYQYPQLIVQFGIDSIHQYGGVPFWLSIAGWTIVFRSFILPLNIKSQKNSIKIAQLKPRLDQINRHFEKIVNPSSSQKIDHQILIKKTFQDNHAKPLLTFLPIIVSSPVFLYTFLSLKTISKKIQAIHTGGFWWIKDLSVPDPYYIIPSLTGLLMMLLLERATSSIPSNSPNDQTLLKWTFRLTSIIIIPFVSQMPACIPLYMVSNTLFSIFQQIMFTSPKYRQILNFPSKDSMPISEQNKIDSLVNSTLLELQIIYNRRISNQIDHIQSSHIMTINFNLIPLIKSEGFNSIMAALICHGISDLYSVENNQPIIDHYTMIALSQVSTQENFSLIRDNNLIRSIEYPWLGYTPHALTEIQGIKTMIYCHLDLVTLELPHLKTCPSHLIDFIQYGLKVTSLSQCLLIYWTPQGYRTLIIPRDNEYFNKLWPKLLNFYQKNLSWWYNNQFEKGRKTLTDLLEVQTRESWKT